MKKIKGRLIGFHINKIEIENPSIGFMDLKMEDWILAKNLFKIFLHEVEFIVDEKNYIKNINFLMMLSLFHIYHIYIISITFKTG